MDVSSFHLGLSIIGEMKKHDEEVREIKRKAAERRAKMEEERL